MTHRDGRWSGHQCRSTPDAPEICGAAVERTFRERSMYKCPWCERKSFSFWQKQSLGPSRALTCKGCHRQVSVPWGRAHLAALPVFLCTLAGMWVIGEAFHSKLYALGGGVAGVVIGMLITMPLYHLFVPLIRPTSR